MEAVENIQELLWQDWYKLCRRSGCPADIRQQVFDELVSRYGKSYRKYHNLEHVQTLLRLISEHTSALRDPNALRLAAWFHDAVYDPYRSNNEAKSAKMALQVLPKMGLEQERSAYIADVINRTADHNGLDADAGTLFFLDADLSILGSPPEKYDSYCQAIRAEYQFVPGMAYRVGRKKVLQGFLDREKIYFSPTMRRRFESQARENLAREIKIL